MSDKAKQYSKGVQAFFIKCLNTLEVVDTTEEFLTERYKAKVDLNTTFYYTEYTINFEFSEKKQFGNNPQKYEVGIVLDALYMREAIMSYTITLSSISEVYALIQDFITTITVIVNSRRKFREASILCKMSDARMRVFHIDEFLSENN